MTVTGVDDALVDGPISYTVTTAAIVSTDPLYAGANPFDVSVANTDNDVAPQVADLVLTATSSATELVPGQTLVYTIVVTNNGPDAATGATLTATAPPGLTFGTWTCVASSGSSCVASGSGQSGDVREPARRRQRHLSTHGLGGPSAAELGHRRDCGDGAARHVRSGADEQRGEHDDDRRAATGRRAGARGGPVVSGPATFDIAYLVDVRNAGAVPLTNLQVSDSLSEAFAQGAPTVSIASPPVTAAPCVANGGFTGIGAD